MSTLLALLSGLVWWVLYSSLLALPCALVAWAVLRWTERCRVPFNRVYLACLLWTLLGAVLLIGTAVHFKLRLAAVLALFAFTPMRLALVLDMLLGVLCLWRLVPRADARRIRPASACLAVAVVVAIGFGAATSLAG